MPISNFYTSMEPSNVCLHNGMLLKNYNIVYNISTTLKILIKMPLNI